jgi:Tol biopolymer transport system component
MNRSSGLAHLRWQLAPCIPIGAVIVALIVVPRAATVPSTAPVKNPATRPILFERYSGEDAPKCCQIFVVHADGRGLKRLRFGSSPSWSPNSQRIAFVRFDDSAVVIMRADGRGTRRVSAPLDSGGSHARATWSPDGRQLAWATAERGRAVVRIATLSRPIALRKILLPDIGFGSPDWSPDGRQFALVSPVGGIYVIGADGHHLRRVVPDLPKAQYNDVRWSPDGRRLLFVRQLSEGREGVYTVRPDGSGLRALIVQKCCSLWGASWSPSGRKIVYTDGKVHTVDVRSRRVRTLRLSSCGTAGSCFEVDW